MLMVTELGPSKVIIPHCNQKWKSVFPKFADKRLAQFGGEGYQCPQGRQLIGVVMWSA
jgi:hypothetical protein